MWHVMRLLVMQYGCGTSFNFGGCSLIFRPLKLFYDNSLAISFFRNTKRTSLSKYIDVNFIFVKEKVGESLTSVEKTPTTSMLANPLTKGLPICVFQEYMTRMGLLGA